ncbi:MAG: type 4a pilus biogenesis protein PilO [Polyangiaceae bacterium]
MATPAAAAGIQAQLAKLGLPAKIGIGAFLAVVLGGVYFLFVYGDVQTKIDGEQKKQDGLRSTLAAQQQAEQSYIADRDELVLRQQRQRDLNKLLPAEAESASFLSAVQQIANVAGIDLKAWKPEPEKDDQFYARVPMKLEVAGKYHQLVKFAYEAGKIDRIINVENFELSSPKLQGDDVVLKATCLATAFHAKKVVEKPAARGGAK